jgi:hypothetical protein
LDKWADYLVSAVKSNPGQPHIDFLEVHSDFGNIVCETAICSRADVIASIKKGCSYATVFKTAIGKWRKGADVCIVCVNGEEYLRTDKNCLPSDNFDNVPEL